MTLCLGLTGGIGSGKSTVARMFAAHGASIIDADLIAHAITARGGSAIEAISTEFGKSLIGSDGAMDRALMRSLVFEDPAARVRLEKILHPQVGIEMRRQIEQAVSQQVACVIVEIPLLIESAHWRSQLHRIATVDCSIEEQVRRVAARSHLDEREARRFVAAQAKREQRLAASDLVIENSGDYLARLEQQVARVIEHFGL